MSQIQISGEAKIRDLQGPVVANSGVITALDGAASQYVRGDGTLADFPTQTGGGSSVSYYLNGSVNQGTFGGSTYYQMSKNAITGTGTNFSTSADGLLAQFITDANDPDATSIPSGNWNIEFFMNVSASSGALASFYVEFYKYNGTTFTLVATNVATPEVLTGTTTIDAYYTSVAFPETALLQTDRLAIRIYANVASKTVTLYTEDNRLCQVVTTFSRGILSLNNLTDQQQYFAVGTSGSDFNIVSSLDTHTFNIPTASATKRGLLSSTDWSTFNNKVPYTGATGNVDLGENSLLASFISANGSIGVSGTISLKQNGSVFGGTGEVTIGSATAGELSIFFGNNSYKATFLNTSLTASRIYTLPNITGTLALLEGNQNFIGFKQFSDTNSTWLDYGISMAKGSTPSSLSSSRVNVYSNSGDKNLVIADTFASFAKLQFQSTGDLTYTFPSSSGTLALSSDLSAYVTLATTQTISGAKTFSATPVFDNGVSGMPLRFKTYGAIGLGVSGYTDIAAVGTTSLGFAFGVSASATKLAYFAFGDISDNIGRTYTFPNADGTIALTSNLSAYVTLATNQTISGQKTFTQNLLLDGNGSNAGTLLLKSNTALPTSIGYTSINSTTNSIYLTTFVSNPKTAALDLSGLSDNAVRTFTFPNTSGTIALTSNIPTNPVGGTGTTNYLPKFTGASTIGNSIIQDATTNIDVAGFAYFRRGGKFLILNPNYNAANVYADIAAESGMDLSFSANGATKQLYLNASGNLGLGVTPSAWGSSWKALELSNGVYLTSLFSSTTPIMILGANAYFDNTNFIYKNSAAATRYQQDSGVHYWYTAPSGTAGNAISFTQSMTLGSNSGLSIGTTTAAPSNGLLVAGTAKFLTAVSIDRSSLTSSNPLLWATSGSNDWFLGSSPLGTSTSDLSLYSYGTSSVVLNISKSTGAATFSNSVTASGLYAITSSEVRLYNANNTNWGTIKGSTDTTNGSISLTGGSGNGMIVTNSGNVGIGTSSPQRLLHINNTTGGASVAQFTNLDTGSGSEDGLLIGITGAEEGAIILKENLSLWFATNDTERMRITSGGDVLIGLTSAIGTGISLADGKYIWSPGTYSNTTANAANMWIGASGIFGRSTSSIKYKTDVKNYDKGLAEVMQIRPVYYKGKNDGNTQFAGLIAEEINDLGLTEFVQYAEDGTPDALAYQNMIALAFKAIQEQTQIIKDLEARIVSLESK